MIKIIDSVVGSQAYGTAVEGSDTDRIIAHSYDSRYYLGMRSGHKVEEQTTSTQKGDTTYYEIQKFVSMCAKFNPNVIISLWNDTNENQYLDDDWKWLKENRKIFSSRIGIRSMIGFATSELMNADRETGKHIGAKGKALIEKYGYNTKSAQNAIRIIRMCYEFLMSNGNTLNVYRLDAETLLDIRNGKWTLEECRFEYNTLKNRVYDLEHRSKLPEHPNYAKIESLMVESMRKTLAL